MGTPFTVSAAVIYMARLEDLLLFVDGLFFYTTSSSGVGVGVYLIFTPLYM